VFRDSGCSITRARMRLRAEVILVEAPRYGAVVDGAATRLIAVVLQRERMCPRIRVGPPGDGLTLDGFPGASDPGHGVDTSWHASANSL
jgi:hypothetical protein